MILCNVSVEHKNYLGIPIADYWLPLESRVEDDIIYFRYDKYTWNIRVRYTIKEFKWEK